MQYVDALKFMLTDEENRGNNILVGSIYSVIPILGPLALSGWHCEIAQRLHHSDPNPIPRLEFGDLMDWFQRGIAPFVASLLVAIPVSVIAGILPVFMIPLIAVGGDVAVIVMLAVFVPAILILSFVTGVFSMAVLTRAELTEDIGKTLDPGAVIGYVKATFGYSLLAIIVYSMLASVLVFVGFFACCVGIFPASVVVNTGVVHLRMQIYQRYLDNGGEAIEIRAADAEAPKFF